LKQQPRPWLSYFVVPIAATLYLCVCHFVVAEKAASQTISSAQQSATKQLPGQVSGHVYRIDTGEPVPKAEVSLYPQGKDTGQYAGSTRIVRTSPDGAFAFSGLPAGSYVLEVSRNGFASYSCQVNGDCKIFPLNRGQNLDNVVLRITPAAVITGEITDQDQEHVADIEVDAVRVSFSPGGQPALSAPYRGITDDRGVFRISNMLPGTYYIRTGGLIVTPMKQMGLKVGPEGGVQYKYTYYPGTGLFEDAEPIEAKPGSETNNVRISVATEKTYSITGALVGEGKAPQASRSYSTVMFTKRSGAAQIGCGDSNGCGSGLGPDGSFRISHLSPGEYTLTAVTETEGKDKIGVAHEEGFASVRIVDSDVRANIEVGRSSELKGKVTAPQGFTFSRNDGVVLQSAGTRIYTSHPDSSGQFDIVNIPPGEFTISLWHDLNPKERGPTYIKHAVCSGSDYASRPITLELGALLDCDLTVADDAGIVSGEVTAGEKLVPGLIVVLIPESRELRRIPRYTLTANTDPAGRFNIAGVIPGDYFIFAVVPSDDHAYFALDFADRNQRTSERVTVASRAAQIVKLTASQVP